MLRKLIRYAILCVSVEAFAQVQWAARVAEVSSEISPKMYGAIQALGVPNALPQGGDNPVAWAPLYDEDGEFIKVAFARPIQVKQLFIAENLNPGSVEKVFFYDTQGKEYLVKHFDRHEAASPARLLSIRIDPTPYKVAAVKVVLACDRVKGMQSIDAIGISSSHAPYKQEVNVAREIGSELIPQKLGAEINSAYSEIGPLVTADGKRLYFSRRFHPQNTGGKKDVEDIWYSDWDEQKKQWKTAVNISKPLNNKKYNFVTSVIEDGNTLVLGNVYGKGGGMSAGMSYARKTGEGWTRPQKMEVPEEDNTSERVNYYLSNSGKILLISAERNDALGNRDLYVSFNLAGQWSTPKNLGPSVNTAAEDYAPFLAADERTLYFSSAGWPGYGSDDIFVTRRIGEGWDQWTTPENLGPAINSPRDDNYFTLPAAGDQAFYTSNSVFGENLDIYQVTLPEARRPKPVVVVSGKVLDQKGKPVAARVSYENLETGEEMGSAQADSATGRYSIVLPLGIKYGYRAEAQNYLSVNTSLDLTKKTDFREVEKDLALVPAKAGASVALNNIFFDFSKASLKPASYPELKRVAAFLKENKSAVVEIGGHADATGSEQVNRKLSLQRAQAVKKYLEKQGIPASRVQVKGYGKSKPVAGNDSAAGRAQNRRVEFMILKK